MNSVSINLRTDEVVIKIDDNAKQEDVIEELDKKLFEDYTEYGEFIEKMSKKNKDSE